MAKRSAKRARASSDAGLDRVRLEVFHHLFAAAAEEMGASLMRSAFSANIKERRDYSCALFDAEGRTIAQAAHLPVHLGSAPMSMRAALESTRMGPGDVVVLNDPYRGGTHLPDVTLVSPVHLAGEEQPSFYCLNRAHHADVGGAHPGSMAPMPDIHGEGLRIPPVHLVRGGTLQEDMLALFLANVRVPRERRGDLLAQWAANRVGARRLEAMAVEHGPQEVRRRAQQLMDWTEQLMADVLGRFPTGSWSFEDGLELPDGAEARIRLKLDVRGGRATFDFRASDPQGSDPVNTVRAVALSAVFYLLRSLLPAGTPTNDGVMRRAEVLTAPGTVVDARYPAPVAAGNVETSQRLVDVILGALSLALPGQMPAASAGTMSNLTFGGMQAERAFTYYETIAGGAGAGPGGPGEHALQTHMTNTRNTPIEALENELPVRVLSYTVRRASGGAGRRPGGDGVVKRLRFLTPVRVSWIAERQRSGPWGAQGGDAGRPGGAWFHLAEGARRRALPGKASLELPAGGELEIHTPGGGGHGRAARTGRGRRG